MSIFAIYILFPFISTYFSKSVDLFSINKISGARLLHSTVHIWNDKEDRTIELVCFPPKRMHCHTHRHTCTEACNLSAPQHCLLPHPVPETG